jgi:DNA-binding MarR family transcriptional regulator
MRPKLPLVSKIVNMTNDSAHDLDCPAPPMDASDASSPLTVPPSLGELTGYLLRRAFVVAHDRAKSEIPEPHHVRDVPILAILQAGGPVSQRRLSEQLGVNRTLMVGLVDGLEEAGLVERTRNPQDRRSYALRLTEEGEQRLAELREHVLRTDDRLTARLTPAQRARLAELLQGLLAGDEPRVPAWLRDRVGFLLAQAHFRSRTRADAALRDLGVEPRHVGALVALGDLPRPASQQDLARALGVSGPVVVELAEELERRGLIERRRSERDRRSYELRVTPRGASTVRRARGRILAVQAELAAGIGEDGDRELRRLLRALLGVAE